MNHLTGYIVRAILRGTAVVALVLVAVASVIEFVVQLDDIGLASYGVSEALGYVMLRVPRKIFDVLPAATLIGALLSLGNLAVHRELVVMRASGVSHVRLLGAVASAGIILLVVMLLLGESLAPKLGEYASQARDEALHENVSATSGQSEWSKEGGGFLVNLRRPADAESFDHVLIFELDGDTALRSIAGGELVSAGQTDAWEMIDFAETRFLPGGTVSSRADDTVRDYGFSEDLFERSNQSAALMPLTELKVRIDRYRELDLDATPFVYEYWGRIANGTSVLIMAMLALPFVLGSLRSADAGVRMIIGLSIGLGYYVLGEVSANTGQVFALDPVVAAWAPSAGLLLITILALARLR